MRFLPKRSLITNKHQRGRFKRAVGFGIRRFLPIFKKAVTYGFFLAVIYGVVYFFSHTGYFSIKNYTYSGVVTFVNSSDFVKLVENNVLGKNLLVFNTHRFEDTLKSNFLGIKTVRVAKHFPAKLDIFVQERVPVAILTSPDGEKYLLDMDGYVLGLVGNAFYDIPVIGYNSPVYVGQFVDKSIAPITINVITEAKLEGVSVSSMSFEPKATVFWVGGHTQVILNNSKSTKDSMKIVSRLVSQASLEGKSISKIDLRYDKVIVLYD
jgi:cell division septal protein FtsQ